MGDNPFETEPIPIETQERSFLRSRWLVVVAVLGVLLCACIICVVVVYLVLPEPPDFLNIDGLIGATPEEEVTGAPPTPAITPVTGADETETPEPSATPTPTVEAVEDSAPVIPVSGYYGVVIRAIAGDLSHALFIALQNWMSLTVRQSDIIFEGPEPWVPVTGTLNEDGSFFAEGRGTVAGNPDVAVTFEGNIFVDPATGNTMLSGDYTMGTEGRLPGGGAIIYRVEGERIGPSAGADAEPGAETVETFLPVFLAAFENDIPFLIERVHPAAEAFYGAKTCESYVQGLDDPTFDIEVLGISDLEVWVWERDGLVAYVANTYTVDANVTTGGQTSQTEIHFGLVNRLLHWFPDCGDPQS